MDALGRNGSRVDVGFVVDLDPPTSSFTAMLPQYVNTSTLALGTRSEDALSSTVVLLRVDSNPWVQSDVFTLSQGPHWFSVMAVDGENFFNSIKWQSVLDRLYATFPELALFVETWYLNLSLIWFYMDDHSVEVILSA